MCINLKFGNLTLGANDMIFICTYYTHTPPPPPPPPPFPGYTQPLITGFNNKEKQFYVKIKRYFIKCIEQNNYFRLILIVYLALECCCFLFVSCFKCEFKNTFIQNNIWIIFL